MFACYIHSLAIYLVKLCICLHVYALCVHVSEGVRDKKTSDPLELKLEAVTNHQHWCWDLNSGSLQDQCVLLTTGLLLQPHYCLSVCLFLIKLIYNSRLKEKPSQCLPRSLADNINYNRSEQCRISRDSSCYQQQGCLSQAKLTSC